MSTTKHYTNQAGFAARTGLAPQAIHYRAQTGQLPVPDVYVGNVVIAGKSIPGWSDARIELYLDFVRPYLSAPSGGRLRLPDDIEFPSWWTVETEWFLNQREAARALGLQPISVSTRIGRGTFGVEPRVIVGHLWHGTAKGWELQDLIRYGQQDKNLDEQGRIADLGQKGPPRKAINPKYYETLAAKRANAALAA